MRLRFLARDGRGLRGALIALLIGSLAWLVAGPLASLSLAQGCDDSWATAVSGSWTDAADWSTGSVPSSTQNACITVSGTYTVTLTGSVTVASLTVGGGTDGQTLAISASHALGAALTLNGDSTNSGTIEETDSDSAGAGSAEADILIGNGDTLTNSGTILSDPGPGAQGTRAIDGHNAASTLDNTSSGTITVNQDLQIDSLQDGLFTTSGNITIASGEKLLVEPSGGFVGGNPAANTAEMDIDGGTITDNGTFGQGISESGSHSVAGGLKVNGGTITGAGLFVVSGSGTDIAGSGVGASFSGAGSGTYTFVGSSSASATTLAGTIGSNQTVVVSASTTNGGVPIQVNSNLTNDGTLELTDSDTSGTNQNAADILIGTGSTLTNNGTITSVGAHGQRIIDGRSASSTLLNASNGTIDAAGNLQLDPSQNGTVTTTGAITVESGQTFQADPNGGSTTFNLNGGSVTDNGTFEIGVNTSGGADSGATFNVGGGTVTGSPIVAAVANTTFSGNGSGSFTLAGATSIFGGGTLAGTIGQGDTVTMAGSTSGTGSAAVSTSGNVVNDGTLTMTDPDTNASASAFDEINIVSGSTFTNAGTMVIDPGPDASGYRSIDGTVDNTGTLKVNMLLQMALHSVSAIDNSGTVDLASGQGLIIGGGSDSYTQSAGTTSLGGGGADLAVAGVLLQGGTVTGSGTICGPDGTQADPCGSASTTTELTNGGTISPSPSPATIAVKGDYTQASGGTLTAGVTSTGSDQLSVSGSADLDGTLQVSTASGFTPADGQMFQIVTASSLSGQFATTTGLQSGPYEIAYNADNVTLTATTPTAGAALSPTAIAFGSAANTVSVGATVSQTLTVTSSATAPLDIGSLSLSGAQASSFSLASDGCSGQTVQPADSCTVSVSFTPSAPGSYTAAVNVPDNAAGSPQQVSLSGVAGAAGARLSISPGSLSFGAVGTGATSAPQSVTVTSTGSGPLTISSVGLTGASPGDYAVSSDNCAGQTLAAGASCTTHVTFTPSANGSRTASLTYADNAPGSPHTVALGGSGTTTGTLTGQVLNGGIPSNPPPLAGATVELCTLEGSTGCQQTTTDAGGNYSFVGLTPRTYRMEALPAVQYLNPASAVLQVHAGANTEDFTLSPPQGIPAGVSVNGQTSGNPVSFWKSPDAIDVPLDPAPTGSPGVVGVTVMDFSAQPAGSDSLGQPDSYGTFEVEYRFDSSGVPRLVAVNSTVDDERSALGSWQTSLTSPPTAGQDVRGLTVQGLFTPAALTTVHGEFDYSINHYSEFGQPASAAPDRRGPIAQAAGGGPLDLLNQIINPSSDPSSKPCPPSLTYNGKGMFTLPNGSQWNAGMRVLTQTDGTHTQISGDAVTTSVVAGDTLYSYPLYQQGGPSPYYTSNGFRTSPPDDNTDLPIANSSGEVAGLDLNIGPNGAYIVDTSNGGNAAQYQLNSDGSVTNTQTGTVWGATGQPRSPGNPQQQNCGGGGPPPPPPPPAPPAPTPNPNHNPNSNNNSWWPWFVQLLLYKDPSGSVKTTTGIPVAGAKVVLERSGRHAGPFKPVPRGSVTMSPSNRRNPDHTTQLGLFGWDVLPGFYRVVAEHAGCTSATGRAKVTRTKALTVPPAVVGLNLVLRCPHLQRSASRTTLKARRIPVDEVMLMAEVRGRHPQGLVKFMRGGRVLGVVPLGPRTGRAALTIVGRASKEITAIYEGDGYNAPSSGTG